MNKIADYLPFVGKYVREIKKQQKTINWYRTYTKNLTKNLKEAWGKNKELENKIKENEKNGRRTIGR